MTRTTRSPSDVPRPWELTDPRAPRLPPYWIRMRDPQIEREHVRLMDELHALVRAQEKANG